MSGLVTTEEKDLVLASGRARMDLAHTVGKEIGCGIPSVTAYDFASGEIYVRFNESVRGADVFVLQSIKDDINRWIMKQLIIIDAAKCASTKHITVVVPFYLHPRQGKKHQGREPISACLTADLYRAAGAGRIMSVDLHALQEQGFFDDPVDRLFATPVPMDYVRSRVDLTSTAIVPPDADCACIAEKWLKEPGGAPLAFAHETRDITRPNVTVANRTVGEVASKKRVLVDDMIDTVDTITEAINVLNNAGVKGIIVVATHGILSDPAAKRLPEPGTVEVVVTNTLPIPAEKRFKQLTIPSIAPLLVCAIQEVFEDGSVTLLSN